MTQKNQQQKTSLSIEDRFEQCLQKLAAQKLAISETVVEVKKLQKMVNKKVAKYEKILNKKKKKRKPSGFAKPSLISKELCVFLGKTPGTEMARTEVTKLITTYIKEKELQNPKDLRIILPDKKLVKLLSLKKTDNLTYFNLQKYMKIHFPKPKPLKSL